MAWYGLLILAAFFAKDCLSEDKIFVATKIVIRSYSLTQFESGRGTYYPIQADNIADIDYDPVEEYLYWADKDKGNINKIKLDGSGSALVYKAQTPTSIALDVGSKTVYFTDTGAHTIERVSFDGSVHKVLVQSDIDKPMSIALDAKNRKMYWAETGDVGLRIEQADLDGSNRVVLVDTGVPRTLTLDVDNNRLYWIDTATSSIMYSDLNGKNVLTSLHKQGVSPSDMAVRGGKIYCSDTASTPSQVWTHDALGGDGDVDVILTLAYWKFAGIYATKTQENEEIMFVAQDHGIMELDLSVERGLGKQIKALSQEIPLAITYDTETDKIYWITSSKELKSAKRDGTDVQLITTTKFNKRGMVLLDQSRGEIFWSEKNQKKIRKRSLSDGDESTVVTGDLEILGFYLDTTKSEIYWVEDDPDHGKIRKLSYGGSGGPEDISTDEKSPTAVVVDIADNSIYWSNLDADKITKKDKDGYITHLPATTGIRYLTLLGNKLYWYTTKESLGVTNLEDETTALIRTKDEREFKSLKIIPDIGACASYPCQNGGTCVTKTEGYSCTCQSGYEGDNCETATGACASDPCKNGGTCVGNTGGYSCTCQSGYEGDNCETATGACASDPCKNGGTCVATTEGYSCTCQSGYEGDNCETATGACASDPCKNGGTCVTKTEGYSCNCQSGYGGDNCETATGACASDPCKNGGTCVTTTEGYSCTCQSGYEGDNCEAVVGVCANNPCKSGGTCVEEASGYKCKCATGFIGANCEIGLVYIALIIPIIALIALIAYCVGKKSAPPRNGYSNYWPQGASNPACRGHDVIVQPMYT